MNALLHAQLALQTALLRDPRHQLACLSAFLDPLSVATHPDDLDPNGEHDEPLQQALLIARACFPAVYVDAVQCLHAGASPADLEACLCQGFSAHGIPLHALDVVWYGIPMPAYGVVLDDPSLDECYPHAEAVLACFGVCHDEDGYRAIPDHAAPVALIVIERLRQLNTPSAQAVAWAVAWLWGVSGNDCVDLDEESLAEYDLLAWDVENVALAQAIIAEADGIMREAVEGLAYLHQHPHALRALRSAVRSARNLYLKAYPKGRIIPHDAPQLAARLRLDGTAFA